MSDVHEFESLLELYKGKVFRLALSILGNRDEAEEAAQEVFLRIWRALPGFRRESSVSTWIYTITRNVSLSVVQSRHPERRQVALDPETLPYSQPPSHVDDDLLRLVAALPERYRQVVVLFYLEEQSYEEVAAMLDLPMGTVKTFLHRARKELAVGLLQARRVRS